MFERRPTPVSTVLHSDPMFVQDDGSVNVRESRCECGAAFEQTQLSARFMRIVEKCGEGAVAALLRDIPEIYVPVHCPPCERRDLGRAARIAEARALPTSRPIFGERDHAAD